METIINILIWVLFALFTVNVLYLLTCSIAARVRKPGVPPRATLKKRFVILIAAYREDKVIEETVQATLNLDYPRDKFDICVISDHMKAETNFRLRQLPIKLLQVDFEQSTNTKSLKAALEYLDPKAYDVALIIDADNIVAPHYLNQVNDAFNVEGVKVVQTHRVAKNINTDMAYLDAMSEEINNSLFRLGHVNLGLSSALIGSGMAFQYDIFYDAMMSNQSVGGFDRVLEMKLLYDGVKFHYLPEAYVKDEKIQRTQNFYQQRRRWLSAQYYSLGEFVHRLIPAILKGKWDFVDKLYQQAALSRVLLLGFTFLIALVTTIFETVPCLEETVPICRYMPWCWWSLFALLALAILLAIPNHFYTWRLVKAIMLVPYSFLLMVANLFRLREANKRFIHTEHGIEENKKK